jgi:branched-chain amino acid transport system ATP-binding protein
MTLLVVSELRKRFGGIAAVNDLSFRVREGSIFGIIGPNGAGKTSLFNLLTGFLSADRGSVRFADREVLGKKPYELTSIGIARSFQLVKPFSGMTAFETLLLPGCAHLRRSEPHARGTSEARAGHLLHVFRLENKRDVPTEDLSQGELRLLDIARALATRPRLLLLDEPFSGLSPQAIFMLSDLLRRYRDDGMTIVIIEHRLRELMALLDTVLVLNFGAKLAEGAPAEIVRDEAVVAAYLGRKAKEIGHALN